MLVAYVTADREALFAIFSNPGKFYVADPYTFLFAGLLILIFGPGKIALDTLADRISSRVPQGLALQVCPGGQAADRVHVPAAQI